MENSKIEWTDHTFNPWWGCVKVSPGCKNCYAETLDNRYHNENPHWGPGSKRKPQSESYWKQPLKWQKEAEKAGKRARVFCASMADFFEVHPDVVEWRNRLFDLIRVTPNLDWLLLTKRPENIMGLVPMDWEIDGFPENVWIGASCENQEQANIRIPHLLALPHVRVKFLSCEPLLGPIDFRKVPGFNRIGLTLYNWWVIVGGESGPGARPMSIEWARILRYQCITAGVPFFFKQWGEWHPYVENMEDLFGPDYSLNKHNADEDMPLMYKVGKKLSGSLLDGVEYKNFPRG